MKKILVALIAALVATAASAQVNNSKHDIGNYAGAGGTGGVCVYCHMPHNGVAVAGAPLWARANSTATYTFYSTATVSSVPAALNINSQLCMSCHDGTLDMAKTLVTDYNGTNNMFIGVGYTGAVATTNLGTNLQNDHPVSITYPAAGGGNSGLATLANAKLDGWFFFGAGANTLECSSCHNPHLVTGTTKFLRVPVGGDVCAGCHSLK